MEESYPPASLDHRAQIWSGLVAEPCTDLVRPDSFPLLWSCRSLYQRTRFTYLHICCYDCWCLTEKVRDLDRKSPPALLRKEDYHCSVIIVAGLNATGWLKPTRHCLTDFTQSKLNKEPPAGLLFSWYLGGSLKCVMCTWKVSPCNEYRWGGLRIHVLLQLTLSCS